MTKKRKSQTACDAPSKRHRGTSERLNDTEFVSFQEKYSSEQPRVDPKYGQRGAFPGLDDGDDDCLFYGPANDGLEYLRMVRSEARGVPSILIAPKPKDEDEDIYDDPYNDCRGYYDDGAYVAAPAFGPYQAYVAETPDELSPDVIAHELSESTDPQDVYYERLLDRFRAHRQLLHTEPSASAIAALDSSHPISFPSNAPHFKSASQEWRGLLSTTDPVAAQLASMDTEAVLNLMRMVRGYLRRGEEVGRRLGAWIWALLGRLPEVGVLGSEEVAVVRELGKRAIWVGQGWRESLADWERREIHGRHGEEGEEGYDGDGEGNRGEEGRYENGKAGTDEERENRETPILNAPFADSHCVADHGLQDSSSVQKNYGEPRQDFITQPSDDIDISTTSLHQHQEPFRATPTVTYPPSAANAHQLIMQDTTGKFPSLPEGDLEALELAKARVLAKFASTNPYPAESYRPDANHSEERASAGDHNDTQRKAQPLAQAEPTLQVDEEEEEGEERSNREEEVKWPSSNTLATLDMIITIAGEMYGQRDLLEFRQIWGEFEER